MFMDSISSTTKIFCGKNCIFWDSKEFFMLTYGQKEKDQEFFYKACFESESNFTICQDLT